MIKIVQVEGGGAGRIGGEVEVGEACRIDGEVVVSTVVGGGAGNISKSTYSGIMSNRQVGHGPKFSGRDDTHASIQLE